MKTVLALTTGVLSGIFVGMSMMAWVEYALGGSVYHAVEKNIGTNRH